MKRIIQTTIMLSLLMFSFIGASAMNSSSHPNQQACCKDDLSDTAVFDDGAAEIAEMVAEGERILQQRLKAKSRDLQSHQVTSSNPDSVNCCM